MKNTLNSLEHDKIIQLNVVLILFIFILCLVLRLRKIKLRKNIIR